VRRREVLAAAATAWPSLVRAQQKAVPVVGSLNSGFAGPAAPYVAAFLRGLKEAGYVDGQNLRVEYRWAEGRYDRFPALAAELVALKVDAIQTSGVTSAVRAAKAATSTIPIVFGAADDPVAAGLVASLARPGGNVTGITFLADELNTKRLGLLRDMVPQAGMIALLANPKNPATGRVIPAMQEAARRNSVQLLVLEASDESQIDDAFAVLVQRHAGGLVVAADTFLNNRRDRITALAARHAIPTIYELREYVTDGGLISFAPSVTGVYVQVGNYVGKILSGARPADLPVLQPTKFELVINLKTAKTLGITMPPSLLATADELIE
jgi:putative ABC transport system substrate-binding protein